MLNKRIKFMGLLILVLSLAITIAGCDMGDGEEDPTPENYNITLDIIGEGEIIEPEEGEYQEGIIEILAEPDEGWNFYRWEGDVQDEFDKDSSVNLDSDKEITAIFIEDYEGDYNDDGFAGWEGTENKPYLIKNSAQLNNVRDEMEAHFILINNIDLTEFNDWDPIGDFEDEKPFIGFLDGRGYEISNLYINLEEVVWVGLFSCLDGEAVVKNLNIINADVTGRFHAGILAGSNGFNDTESHIFNVHTSGNVEALSAVGGIVGTNYGLVEDSSSDSTVIGTGVEVEEAGKLSNSGGLAGQNPGGRIINSFASGKVSGEGGNIGGLLGVAGGEIDNCYAEGEVNGDFRVGGLVGHLWLESEIKNSYATGDIKGEDSVGGLVGVSYGEILNSFALGEVHGEVVDGGHYGGLVGDLNGFVSQSFADVKVEIQNSDGHAVAGGLIGWIWSDGEVENSYAVGDINNDGGMGGTGGLSGGNEGIVINSYAAGEVNAESSLGGLVGFNRENAVVENSYYDKDTTNQDDDEGKGIPKTTEEMIQQDTFEPEWDFDTIWDIEEGNSYPYLQWQEGENIPVPPDN